VAADRNAGARSVLGRLRDRLLGRRAPAPLDPDQPGLVAVAEGFEDWEACSAVLERAAASEPRWNPGAQAVLRHHVRLPRAAVAEAERIAGLDGYTLQPGQAAGAGDEDVAAEAEVILRRVQVLDALRCAQEKSRMASLAQRLGGTAVGWDALQPGREAGSTGAEQPGAGNPGEGPSDG
jgi:hypothetical protein